MDRLVQHNVLAMSGRAVEAAGDVDTLLLDKTGTITLGNRMATEFIPVLDVGPHDLAEAAQLASLADETPEGRSIVVLAKREYNLRGREFAEHEAAVHRLFSADPDERRRTSPAARSARAPPISRQIRPRTAAARCRPNWTRIVEHIATERWHSAGGRRRHAQAWA